ncbi:Phosphate acetyltransferase [Pseudomonas marincola]|uniref:Phosphate acetyltransferase n=1 Tax=Pseudomonas marincola TaxID=437900 RepID=A0A653E4M4_9PSED|nr:bifunctional enoyl-CoA hydratase/phosphate acetyltransferase [Pseudomonas marincola]CAE6895954.1 Phosphate acetyltransferase [Pseudomonas marincola]
MLSTTARECPAFLLNRAKALPQVVTAVVNPVNLLTLGSAKQAFDEGLIDPVLVGDIQQMRGLAEQLDWDLNGIRLIAAADEAESAAISCALAGKGEASALMKGHLHTDTLLRAVLKRDAGLRTASRLSHVFHMTLPGSDKALSITDAVINVQPSIIDKVHIARNAIQLMHALGYESPRMAILSGTEEVSSSMPSSQDAAELTKLAAIGAISGARIEGPLGFDNAISAEAAKIKGIAGQVCGNADILLVPNLESGNFLFKQMVYFMSATAAGLVLGAKVPIILTSRADPLEARLASCALSSIFIDYCAQTPERALAV